MSDFTNLKSRPDCYNWYYRVILSEVRAFHVIRNPKQLHWPLMRSHIIWQPNVYSALIFAGIFIQAFTHNASLLTATVLLTWWGEPRSWLNRWLSRWTSWLSRWPCGWRSRGDFWKHTITWTILRLFTSNFFKLPQNNSFNSHTKAIVFSLDLRITMVVIINLSQVLQQKRQTHPNNPFHITEC